MTLTNEDLLAISQLLDVKISSALQSELQPIRDDIRDLRNDMNAEFNKVYAKMLAENYVPAAKQYERAMPEIQAMKADIDLMKKVIAEHSEKLQQLA